jgi:hypothetical protein
MIFEADVFFFVSIEINIIWDIVSSFLCLEMKNSCV